MAGDDPRGRIRSLLAEFDRSIGPQKLQLEALLPNVWKATYGASPSIAPPPQAQHAPVVPHAVKGAGPKRAPSPLPVEAPKRRRSDEIERRIEAILKSCLLIITKKLWHIKSATWFKEPVDPIKYGIPNYYNFVKRPMDLGTVKRKLQTSAYKSPMDFKEDVDLVWSNCASYNQEGSSARVAGDSCKAVWERAWRDSGIEEQWQQIQYELDPTGAPLHERLGALNSQLIKALDALPGTNQPEARGLDMRFIEKRRLSLRLAQATPDLYQSILDIVAEDTTFDGDEVELVIDDLKEGTLWKLQDLLDRPPVRSSAVGQKGVGGGRGAPHLPSGKAATSSGAIAEKALPVRSQNGAASTVHSSGGASDSDDDHQSSHEVKGSTMDDPNQGTHVFVRDGRNNVVDESATYPKEQSQFVKDRAAARKTDVNINTANWTDDSLTAVPSEAVALDVQPEADDMWKSFQSIAEQKQQREEQQRQQAAQAEQQQREERERKKREEEERQRRLREEEERQAAETQKQRDAQRQKEVEEIKAMAGTANLTQQSDVAMLAISVMSAPAGSGQGLAALGLDQRDDDDDDMNFDDDE